MSTTFYRNNSIHHQKPSNKLLISLKQKSSCKLNEQKSSYRILSRYDNKVDMESTYQDNLRQIERSKEILEEKLSIIVNELNRKEVDIFNILKVNLEEFKEDLKKYEMMYNETIIKSEAIEEEIVQSKAMENILYNHTFMLHEDSYSCNNELMLLKAKAKEKIIQLKEIEYSYPKEYKFMQQEFQLENELKNMTMKLNSNKINLKRLIKEKNNDYIEREELIRKLFLIESKSKTIAKEMNRKNEEEKHFHCLEKTIEDNVIDVHLWKELKESLVILYSNDTFNNSELDKLLLSIKMLLIKVKKEKMDDITLLESQLEETIKQLSEKNTDNIFYNDTIDILKENINQITTDYTFLCIFQKQYEEIYIKYTTACHNHTLYDLRLEIISYLISNNSNETIESFNDLISLYINEINKLNKAYNAINIFQNQDKENVIQLNLRIDAINVDISNKDTKINLLTSDNKQLLNDIAELNKAIKLLNINFKGNLESLGENQFNLYLDLNSSILNNMRKIYGERVIKKVFKKQKNKFYENILSEHLSKKSRINNSIEFIVHYDYHVSIYRSQINQLEHHYQELFTKYEACINCNKMKRKEKDLLDDSNKELKLRIENILKGNIDSIQIQRQKLQIQMNINADLEHVKGLKKDIEKLFSAKTQMMNDYELFVKEYNDKKEHKKYNQTLDVSINNQKVFYSLISNTNDSKHNIKRNESHKEYVILSIEDNVKKSLNDFHKSIDKKQLVLSNAKSCNSIFDNTAYATNDGNDISSSTKSLSRFYSKSNIVESSIDPLKTLKSGLSLYVKFDNNTIISRLNQFTPFKSEQNPPESCGYALKYFKLNPSANAIEIKHSSTSIRYEQKISIKSLHSIILSKTIKLNSNEESYANNIPFTLVLTQSKLGLIAPNYLIYTQFKNAIMKLISKK